MPLRGPHQVFHGTVPTVDAYRALLVNTARVRNLPVVIDRARLVAYVNKGNWCADCPNCDAGISIHPGWDFAACLECCHSFTEIVLPSEFREIEEVLEKRPLRNQHWLSAEQRKKWEGFDRIDLPAETVEDLKAENEKHLVEEKR